MANRGLGEGITQVGQANAFAGSNGGGVNSFRIVLTCLMTLLRTRTNRPLLQGLDQILALISR